jgi:hypothetical protein
VLARGVAVDVSGSANINPERLCAPSIHLSLVTTDVSSLTLLLASSPSGLQLKGCLHRVIPMAEDLEGARLRFALAFFLRSELNALFVDEQMWEWKGEE